MFAQARGHLDRINLQIVRSVWNDISLVGPLIGRSETESAAAKIGTGVRITEGEESIYQASFEEQHIVYNDALVDTRLFTILSMDGFNSLISIFGQIPEIFWPLGGDYWAFELHYWRKEVCLKIIVG